MKIVVAAAGAGTVPAAWACTSSAAFLVYGVMQSSDGVSIDVKSTGAGMGISSPTFVIGGAANDTVTFTFSPEASGFLTLYTDDEKATASIKLLPH
jgi:hypothetical protein